MPTDGNQNNNPAQSFYDAPEFRRSESAVFLKTKEKFGGLSNMAGGFPLKVNGIPIRTSEALYQACRFPHKPDLQRLIIEQKSPMTAKMKGKPYRDESRPDWDSVKLAIMRWSLEVKLAQNWDAFSELLRSTGDRKIVEHSRKDAFWGAKPIDDERLAGANYLGLLLDNLRKKVNRESQESLLYVPPPFFIPDFLLYGKQIAAIDERSALTTKPDKPAYQPAEVAAASDSAAATRLLLPA